MYTRTAVYNIVNLAICSIAFIILFIMAISLPLFKKRKKQLRLLLICVCIQLTGMIIGMISLAVRVRFHMDVQELDFVRFLHTIAYQFFFAYLCFDDEDNFIPGIFAKSFAGVILLVGLASIAFAPIWEYWYGVEILTLVQIICMIPVMVSVHGKSKGLRKLVIAVIFPIVGILAQLLVFKINFDYVALPMTLLMVLFNYQLQLERNLMVSEKELADSKVRLLLEQIQPHFIFNSLSTIEELYMEEPEKASRCVHDFSGYLRTNLDAMSENKLVPLEDELENVKQYVSLEMADPCCDFQVHYDLKVKDVMVPVLCIEPLVENAIRHGLAATGRGGNVWIETERGDDEVLIKVRDDGKGIDHVTEHQRKRRGIGRENVKRRLEAQCGGYLDYTSLENGTEAVIHIPAKE